MPYMLIPHESTSNRVAVWIGAIGEDPGQVPLILRSEAGEVTLNAGDWQSWPNKNSPKLRHQTVSFTNLTSAMTLHLELRDVLGQRAKASATTLPLQLPTLDDPAFTVLLGSCFCRRQDEEGRVGNTYAHLPPGARPNLKIFCGDQVYLDDPVENFTLSFHSRKEMEDLFFLNYQRTWTQAGLYSGFQKMLEDGANYFSADDHELWNNAPNRATLISDSWTEGGRKNWLDVAKPLYRIFQTSLSETQFSVGNLSFLITDTRLDRTADRAQFMTSQHLDVVVAWVRGLRGPGVLVIGQPVLTKKTNYLTGSFGDWSLADYQQYATLAATLLSSTHSIVILTGDVHFSRVAACRINPGDQSGAELIEVISSPMSLVDRLVKGAWKKAPDLFPSFEVPGLNRRPVITNEKFKLNENHFLTVGFARSGAKVKMNITAWLISDAMQPKPMMVSEPFYLI
jgi:hypothetical protein